MVGEGVTMSPMSYNTTIVVRIRQLDDSATLSDDMAIYRP